MSAIYAHTTPVVLTIGGDWESMQGARFWVGLRAFCARRLWHALYEDDRVYPSSGMQGTPPALNPLISPLLDG